MTVVLLANVYTGSVVDKAIMRIIGASLGAWFGYLLAGLVVNSLFLFLIAIFLLVSLAIYYYSFSPYAYAYLLAALSAFIVIAQLGIRPADSFYVAIWRPIEIGLGVLVSALSAWCIFPNNIQDNLLKDAELIFDDMNHLFEKLNRFFIESEESESSLQGIRDANLAIKRQIRKSTEMFGFARRELGIKRVKIDQYRALFDQFYNFTRSLSYFISSYNAQMSHEESAEIKAAIGNFFRAAIQDLETLKSEFFKQEKIKFNLQTELMLNPLQVMVTSLPLPLVKAYLEISPLLQQIKSMLVHLTNILIHNAKPSNPKVSYITNQQQLRNDRDVIINSIKTALAADLALGFWLVSHWPGGVNGIISSIIISIKKNLFEMKSIGIYRFLGCLLGGGVALFPLTFFSMDLYSFILIVFTSVWTFSYLSFKYSSYNYIGLQANVALIIALGQAGGPPIALEPALERLGGIIIGIVASVLVANVFWRVDFFSLLNRHLQKLHGFLTYNLKKVLQVHHKALRLYDLTALFWLCRGLLEAFPDDYFKGPKQAKLIAAKNYFIQLTLIQATLSNIYEGLDKESAHRIAADYGIDVPDLEKAILALSQAKEQDRYESKKQDIHKRLITMDLSSKYLANPSEELANCIAYIKALQQLTQGFVELSKGEGAR